MYKDMLTQYWGLTEIQIIEQKSRRVFRIQTSDQEYYLKRYGAQGQLLEYPVLQFLEQQGVRTELPIPTVHGQILTRHAEDSFALYRALPGVSFSDHYSDQGEQQAYKLGRAIGHLHRGLAPFVVPEPSPYPSTSLLDTVSSWDRYLRAQGQWSDRLIAILDEFNRCMLELDPYLTKHLIHRDSHPSNILFDEDGNPGFVDFELLRSYVRIFDPCYCSTSILVEAGGDEGKRRRWPLLFQKLLAGYDALCPLSCAEQKALRYVVFAIQIIFIGWWAKSGNQEQAELNAQQLFWLYENCPQI